MNKIRTVVPAFFNALRNKETPMAAKLAVIAAILYAILPADIVTDIIPVLGWLDDAVVMTILIAVANKMIPDAVMDAEKQEVIDDVDYEVVDD